MTWRRFSVLLSGLSSNSQCAALMQDQQLSHGGGEVLVVGADEF